MGPNPLAIQELLNNCLDFLHDSTAALRACALVSRAWLAPAQSHLFRDFIAGRPRFTKRFRQTLLTSPHLIRHVRRLQIQMNSRDVPTLSGICTLPFTHLHSLFITASYPLSESMEMAFQHLLRSPTLRCVRLRSIFPEPAIFRECSPSIRDVELICIGRKSFIDKDTSPIWHQRPTVPLQCLHLLGYSDSLVHALMHNLYPFDLSQLKSFKMNGSAEIPWRQFGPVVETIETLSLVSINPKTPLDFSVFPALNLAPPIHAEGPPAHYP
ncbi:hypothetical protein DFH06DRAFT_1325019 [Mycena polygramma]|nr:hypothetical protein DFH06DRAFT_1325019 [Mycena polygramma]